SISVFVAQNTGAGNKKRALKGFGEGLFALVALGVVASCILYLSAEQSIALFIGTHQAAAIAEGVAYMRLVCFFYVLSYTGSSFVGFFRGSGRINIPFIGTTMHLSVRVVLSYWLAPVMGLKAVALATGVGWVSIVLFQLVIFAAIRRRERKLELSGAPL
ncbi:MAG TPA: MATE family efflux transporter, partial [Synergistales bacterium]|nr:MATE family efflux transporter [Synergistales bacterium]